MPELPEVETTRRTAEQHLLDRTITGVACDDDLVLRNTPPQGLGRALTGPPVTTVDRTRKWLRVRTDARSDALVHLGMSGPLRWRADGERREITGVLGLDALAADADDLRDRVGDSRAGLKSAHDPLCPRCGARLDEATVAGRASRWCPREQPDRR